MEDKMNKLVLTLIVMLFTVTLAFGDWTIDEGFEEGSIPESWTIYDEDEDGHMWQAYQNPSYAHAGNWAAFVDSYNPNQSDDWLITPQILIEEGYSFTFYARSWYDTEDFEVKLSTTGNATSDFDVTLGNVTEVSNSYTEYTYDLTQYEGQDVYLAIHWTCATYGLLVDDVKVGSNVAADIGMVSIEIPSNYHLVNNEIFPSGTIKNFGITDVTTDFDVYCEIVNNSSQVVYNSSVTHSGTLGAGVTDSITFIDSWIPTEIGNYVVTMVTDLDGDEHPDNDSISSETEIVQHYGTGGPDAFGYKWIDSHVDGGPEYNWIEISETGTSAITYGVDEFHGDDNFSEPINFGFSFPFYGIDRDYFYVDVNGEILLAENNWYEPYPNSGWNSDGNMFNYAYPIPGYTGMPGLVAVYWDDLVADDGVGDVFFQTFGEAPNRYCVVEWYNLRFNAGSVEDTTLTFQAIFYENGEIVFQYQNTAIGQTGSNLPHDNGQSATVAIQNDTADIGLCYLREIVENGQYIGVEPPGNLLHNELAIRLYTDIDNQPPTFIYEEIGNTFNNISELSLTITDMSGILSDTLYYNIGNGWEAITHCNFEEPNIYYYEFPEFPSNTTVDYYFAATDDSDAHNRATLPSNAPDSCFSFKILPTEGVEVLLATPGTKIGYQDYQNIEFPKFIMALDAAGISYDIYNWAEYETYRFPETYKAIFLYSNASSASSIHDTLSLALMDFLDSGTSYNPKNLFMASDEFAHAQYGYPNSKPMKKFYTAYLRGGYIPQQSPPIFGGTDGLGGNPLDYYEGSIIGVTGSPIGEAGEELTVYANTPDVIYERSCPDWYADEVTNPEISSNPSFLFEDGPINGNAYSKGHCCAIWLDNVIYKSFFTSFDISQFSDDDINMLISDAVDWFIEPQNIDNPEEEILTDNTFKLSQNFPNPFNSTTNIHYSIPENSKVTLEIYNILGQKVKKLVNNEHKPSGTYQAVWDGKDESGKQVPSGIYFYKLSSGKKLTVKKMLLVR